VFVENVVIVLTKRFLAQTRGKTQEHVTIVRNVNDICVAIV